VGCSRCASLARSRWPSRSRQVDATILDSDRLENTMTRIRLAACLVTLGLAQPTIARAQDAAVLRQQLMSHFDMSMNKVIALAEAMPADRYEWKPQADAMP